MNDDHSGAGGSAFREYERRSARDRAAFETAKNRVRDRFGGGRLGSVVAALAVDDSERMTTKVWQQGAIGEAKVGAMLDELVGSNVAVLHDRRLPGRRANIDHLVVTEACVWVIDTKRYVGKRPEQYSEGGFLGFVAKTGLKVGGRSRDALVDGVRNQMLCVGDALDSAVPLRGALCFVDADWPLVGGDFTIGDVYVVWPKLLRRAIDKSRGGDLDVLQVSKTLESKFRSA